MTIEPEPIGQISEVASIIHDLRNPLATIHGGAEMLVRSMLSQTQIQRIADNMYRASVRMGELLEEFLDQSRRAAEKGIYPIFVIWSPAPSPRLRLVLNRNL